MSGRLPRKSILILSTISAWFVVFVAGLFILVSLFWFASCALKSARAEGLLSPGDLEYQGAFQVPPWKKGPERFGYGMKALAYNPGRGSLFASGHGPMQGHHGNLVGEISIPAPSLEKPYQRAVLLQAFGDVAGPLREKLQKEKLDTFGGIEVVDGQLYWSFFRFYAVQPTASIDVATLGRSSLDLSRPQSEGLWKMGPYGSSLYSQKKTSAYLTEIPQGWSDLHTPGRRLAAGKGDGAGNIEVSHGPALFAVAIPDGDAGSALAATPLIYYPPAKQNQTEKFPGWSACDRWEGVSWIAGERTAILFAGRRGLGTTRYGSANGDCETAKGYHCDPYQTEILFYDPVDVARSAIGEIETYEVLPYARLHPEFDGHHCSKSVGGMAFNEDRGELYLVQDNKENPIVHVWKIKSDTTEGEFPVITLMDAKLESISDQMAVLILEGARPEDLVAAFELAKLKAEEWKTNERFESISEEGQ